MSHTNYPSPRIRLRQIALVAPDLKLAAAQLHAVLDSESVWSDPGVNKFGLDNILVPVGGNIFEVVAPQPGKKNSEIPGGRFMDRLGAKKGAGYMWITMAPDPVAERARVTSLVVPAEMQQGGNQSGAQKLAAGSGKVQTIRTVAQLDRPDWAYTQYHPVDIRGGNILEIEGTKPPSVTYLNEEFAPWYPVSLENPHTKNYEPTWWVPFAKKQAPGKRVIGSTVSVSPSDDPSGAAGVANWWQKILDLPTELRGDGGWMIKLHGGVELRFMENKRLFAGAEGAIEHLEKNTAIAVVDIGCVKGHATAKQSYDNAVRALGSTQAGTWQTAVLEGVPAIQVMGVWFRYFDLPEGSTRGLAVPAAQARL